MSLRGKILLKDLLLLACLLCMIGGAIWGLVRQREHVRASLAEYTALQKVETAEIHLVAFSRQVHSGKGTQPRAMEELAGASLALRQYKALITQYDTVLPPEIPAALRTDAGQRTNRLVVSLVNLNTQLSSSRTLPVSTEELSALVDQMTVDMTDLLSVCNGFVHRTQLESAADLRLAIIGVPTIAGLTFAVATAMSFWQYWRLMLPLNRLRRWCRVTASGNFSHPYHPGGDREFIELGEDVNKMALELDAFRRRLEAMVESKGRELIRSERLASVGYLAAGVAHEINTPLNIMSGYAELLIKRLGRSAGGESESQMQQHLSIIRSEAFRCKEITQKLLSLARGDDGAREQISLADTVMQVIPMVRALKSAAGKKIDVSLPNSEKMLIHGNLNEIKQVLLNLLVNAIEAVSPGCGIITVNGRITGEWAELEVMDNGRGMSAKTLDRVFEPFFTCKRGAGEPGTGLGLSITYAIITHHQGTIVAHSDGLDRGSRFVVRLPAIAALEPAVATDRVF
jgi:signal transduction histidine kinase